MLITSARCLYNYVSPLVAPFFQNPECKPDKGKKYTVYYCNT